MTKNIELVDYMDHTIEFVKEIEWNHAVSIAEDNGWIINGDSFDDYEAMCAECAQSDARG